MNDIIQQLGSQELKDKYSDVNFMSVAFDHKFEAFRDDERVTNTKLNEQAGAVLYDMLEIVLHFSDQKIQLHPKTDHHQVKIFDFREFNNGHGINFKTSEYEEEQFEDILMGVNYFVFLFLLIQYMLDYGVMISKSSLKYKLPKCLHYLEKSINSTRLINSNPGWYYLFVYWLNVLRLKYFIRSIAIASRDNHTHMHNGTSQSSSGERLSFKTLSQIKLKADKLLNNCKKSKMSNENWMSTISRLGAMEIMVYNTLKENLLLDCDFELARVLIGKPSSRLRRLICHKIDDKIFTNLNKVSKKRKYFCLMKRFELVKDYGSIRGCNYIKKIKNQVGKSKFKSVIKLLVFLGLSRYGLQSSSGTSQNVSGSDKREIDSCPQIVRPFVLHNLCSLKQCENCLVKFVKLHRCNMNGKHVFFCGHKCEYAIWERKNRCKR